MQSKFQMQKNHKSTNIDWTMEGFFNGEATDSQNARGYVITLWGICKVGTCCWTWMLFVLILLSLTICVKSTNNATNCSKYEDCRDCVFGDGCVWVLYREHDSQYDAACEFYTNQTHFVNQNATENCTICYYNAELEVVSFSARWNCYTQDFILLMAAALTFVSCLQFMFLSKMYVLFAFISSFACSPVSKRNALVQQRSQAQLNAYFNFRIEDTGVDAFTNDWFCTLRFVL
jgi:hypothetical protein